MKKYCLAFTAICSFNICIIAQNYSLNSSSLTWKIAPQPVVSNDSLQIFKDDYSDAPWVTGIVPGTVFGSYVAAGLENDPNYGDNIYKVDKQKYNCNFWYRTIFYLPQHFVKDKLWLHFDGVNRDADIFLNGSYLGTVKGILQRGIFDISRWSALKEFVLVVLVHIPQQPVSNGASPTYGSSGGWDWMPPVPGLNMGITDNVYVSTTGNVTINDPWIQSQLPDNRLARLKLEADLNNFSTTEQNVVINGTINPGSINFTLNVNLQANSSKKAIIDNEGFPQLTIANPRLWWPNGYGSPDLYSCQLSVEVNGTVSDSRTITFGIRKLDVDTTHNLMKIKVNGVPVFVKGGNWGMPEYMLRCRGNDYDTRIKMHRDMNFNIIRNWMGSTTDNDFYDACDKYGIMVWDDFWLNSSGGLPEDINVFNANAVEKIKRLRNHVCIALWCGDNEGDPIAPLNDWLRADVKAFDGRHYHPNSHSYSLSGSGPWSPLLPSDYFARAAPGNWGGTDGWGMRSEMGTAVFVNVESFKKFIPKENWWPRNDMWDKHFFGPSATYAGPDTYEKFINERYGQPTSIEDFCKKAQLLNIETNKAMFEGWADNLWNDATGLIIWMSQPAYPSLVWQTYDYYLDATGAYWGAKKACEPVHIQWNCSNGKIKIINTTLNDFSNLMAEARIYDLNGNEMTSQARSVKLNAGSNTATTCFTVPSPTADLALGKPVTASSVHVVGREPDKVNDGDNNTRWESDFDPQQWICIDLEEPKLINKVVLSWDRASARVYKIQVSDNASQWKDVYYNYDCKKGIETALFNPVTARYVRMYCIEKATSYGVSLYSMEIYGDNKEQINDTHLLRLMLKDDKGSIISENTYLRGKEPFNYKSVNNMKIPDLKVTSKVTTLNGVCSIDAQIENTPSSPSVALAVRVKVVKIKSGEVVLPFFASDNYFTIFKNEIKNLHVDFDASLLGGDEPKLVIEPYNSVK